MSEETEDLTTSKAATTEIVDELESDFEAFNAAHSSHEVEQVTSTEQNTDDIFEAEISDADNFKLQIFLSLMFALLDGFHAFMYSFITKYKITREDIGLDEGDRQGLEIYFRTQKVMDMINRMPVELIGIIHIEYMYFNKFTEIKKSLKEKEALQELFPGDHEEDQEEEDQEEEWPSQEMKEMMDKKPAKKAAVKKVPAKKKPAKKAAKKAPAKKSETFVIEP